MRQIRAVVAIVGLIGRLKPSLSKARAESISLRAWRIHPIEKCGSAKLS
jgi:hypothetical protein